MQVCKCCGQVTGVAAYNKMLWDIYYRLDDGRQHQEAIWFTMEEYHDSYEPEFDEYNADHAMERNMHERGICTECRRPNLTGVTDDMILSEEDAQDRADMAAEQAAERRAGC